MLAISLEFHNFINRLKEKLQVNQTEAVPYCALQKCSKRKHPFIFDLLLRNLLSVFIIVKT